MEKLKELHSIVSLHPFRESLDERYYNGYYKAVENLLLEFSRHIKPIILRGFSHDYMSALFSIRYFPNKPKNEKDLDGISLNDLIEHSERCQGVIHRYIKSGEIPFYWTFYQGSNKLKSSNRLRKWVLENGNYETEYSEEELKNILNEISDKKTRSGSFGSDIYSEDNYNYYKEKLDGKKKRNNI